MRRLNALSIAAAALAFGAWPARAGVMPDLNPVLPEHVREAKYADADTQRYPTTWSDEAAQRLGVQDGKWEAFHTTPSSQFEPSFSAGADAGGAMLKLQWH